MCETPKLPTRRDFFARTCDGLLGAALTGLLCDDFFAGTSALGEEPETHRSQPHNLRPKPTHHRATAKSVIHLFMNGGPSQMDLFDPKPVLNGMDGKSYPGNIEEIGNSNTDKIGVVMGGQYKFARHGKSPGAKGPRTPV